MAGKFKKDLSAQFDSRDHKRGREKSSNRTAYILSTHIMSQFTQSAQHQGDWGVLPSFTQTQGMIQVWIKPQGGTNLGALSPKGGGVGEPLKSEGTKSAHRMFIWRTEISEMGV